MQWPPSGVTSLLQIVGLDKKSEIKIATHIVTDRVGKTTTGIFMSSRAVGIQGDFWHKHMYIMVQ